MLFRSPADGRGHAPDCAVILAEDDLVDDAEQLLYEAIGDDGRGGFVLITPEERAAVDAAIAAALEPDDAPGLRWAQQGEAAAAGQWLGRHA